MFCPRCKNEYAKDIKICPNCGTLLKETLAQEDTEPQFVELVTIFETRDRALISFIKSVLEEAGIKYFVNGESLLNLGRAAVDVKIQVEKKDIGTASELLKDII